MNTLLKRISAVLIEQPFELFVGQNLKGDRIVHGEDFLTALFVVGQANVIRIGKAAEFDFCGRVEDALPEDLLVFIYGFCVFGIIRHEVAPHLHELQAGHDGCSAAVFIRVVLIVQEQEGNLHFRHRHLFAFGACVCDCKIRIDLILHIIVQVCQEARGNFAVEIVVRTAGDIRALGLRAFRFAYVR